VLAAPQLLAKLAVDLMKSTRGNSTHPLPILHQRKNIRVFAYHTKNSTSSCTSSLKHTQQNHGVQLKLKTKPGGEESAAHLRRRRTSSSQEQVQEVKDKLGAELGG
jgi:hypothetical protein